MTADPAPIESVVQDEEMVRIMCAAVDAGDAQLFGSFFSDDASYRFANQEPIRGRAAVIAATAGAAAALPWVRHTIDQIARVDDQLFCRFTIYTAGPDGGTLALPCVTVIEMTHGLITDYRVHMDITPALS